jgi:hypothetical protein
MIPDVKRLQVTMEQMERLIRALEDLKAMVLPKDPQLFASMAEAPLEDLARLRAQISEYVDALKATA